MITFVFDLKKFEKINKWNKILLIKELQAIPNASARLMYLKQLKMYR